MEGKEVARSDWGRSSGQPEKTQVPGKMQGSSSLTQMHPKRVPSKSQLPIVQRNRGTALDQRHIDEDTVANDDDDSSVQDLEFPNPAKAGRKGEEESLKSTEESSSEMDEEVVELPPAPQPRKKPTFAGPDHIVLIPKDQERAVKVKRKWKRNTERRRHVRETLHRIGGHLCRKGPDNRISSYHYVHPGTPYEEE